jgi:hypothetical protein
VVLSAEVGTLALLPEEQMGAHPWFYFVPYEKDITKGLGALREREFKAGRYNPSEPFPGFPVDPRRLPGSKHSSIEAARAAASASGTRSILDMTRISARPDFGAVAPLDEAELMDLFAIVTPTRADIEANEAIFDQIERGQGIYVVVYENDEPSQVYFAGYSYD